MVIQDDMRVREGVYFTNMLRVVYINVFVYVSWSRPQSYWISFPAKSRVDYEL